MTEKLTTLLHDRADAVDFAAPDVDALVRSGDRRVRRRRTALAAGVAAVAVVAAGALAQVLPGSDDSAPDPAEPVYPVQVREEQPIFTIGSLVVEGDRRVRMEHPVDSLVRTRAGWVYLSDDDVYSYVDGVTTRLSEGPSFLVTSDEDGVLAAWQEDSGAQARIAVVDLRTGDLTRLEPQGAGRNSVELNDLDGDRVYWRDVRGSVVTDLATGEQSVLDEQVVVDVENGVVASMPDDSLGTRLTTPGGAVDLDSGDVGVLSPDGAWYASEGIGFFQDRPGVADTTTGRVVRLVTGAEPGDLEVPSGWLDATTVAVALIAEADGDPDRLLTCQVPSGACTVAVDDVGSYSRERSAGRTFPGGGHL